MSTSNGVKAEEAGTRRVDSELVCEGKVGHTIKDHFDLQSRRNG